MSGIRPGFIFQILILTGLGLLTSCSGKGGGEKALAELYPNTEPATVPELKPEEKIEPPRYFYPYSAKRDPFAPLMGGPGVASGSSGGLTKGELTNLELKGILKDRKGKVALITSTDGEPFVVKSGRIYDRKNRIVSGVSGIIKEKSVVLISRNRTMTELTMRKKDEGNLTTSPQ